ncbi:MAG: SBBP repeat-containing protein [Bacilli bacterium]
MLETTNLKIPIPTTEDDFNLDEHIKMINAIETNAASKKELQDGLSNHTHEEYAAKSHGHSEYAEKVHTHQEYALKSEIGAAGGAVKTYLNHVLLESDTNEVLIGIENYDSLIDNLVVYKNSVYMHEGRHYGKDSLKITSLDGNWPAQTNFDFIVYKNFNSPEECFSGTLLTNDSITNEKLSTDIKIGSLATLKTIEKESIVGAINEVEAAVGNIIVGDGTLTQKGVVQLSNALDSEDETRAATSKAVCALNTEIIEIGSVVDVTHGEILALETLIQAEAVKITAIQNAKGQANGYASLDENGKVPNTQLPAMNYVQTDGKTATGELATQEKENIIEAINEVFQYANDGKTRIASVVGAPVTPSDTFTQMSDKIATSKTKLASNLTSKGVTANGGESLDALAGKVADVKTGKYNVGDVLTGVNVDAVGGKGTEIWANSDVANEHGVAVDSAGNVYCAHYISSGKTIRKLNPSGTEIWSNTNSVVAYARGITVDNAGNVYSTCDGSMNTITKFNSGGSPLWANTQVPNGYGVAVDGAGNVYCANTVSSGKTVRKLNPSGVEIWSNSDVLSGHGVAVDSEGNVYCANGVSTKAIRKLNPQGTEIWANSDVTNGYGVAVDSEGNVYCAHNTTTKPIRKLNPQGVEIWANSDVIAGFAVDVDSEGNVYCANTGSTKAIRKLSPNGTEIWGNSDVVSGRGVVVDSEGNVYCANLVSGKAVRKLHGDIRVTITS